jgi:hypothetical protein
VLPVTQSAVSGTIPSLGILEEVDNSLVVKAYIVRAALEL